MMLGMSLSTFTLVHVLLSLVGIGSGFIVMYGLLAARRMDGWTAIFLSTTILTSVTGFGFPAERLLPSHIIGILSLIVLAAAVLGRYVFQLAGPWRRIYTIGATVGLYFNTFVGVVQAFQKIPALKALAPTGTEPPFAIAQLLVLVFFVWLGVRGTMRFHIDTLRTA